MWLSAGDRGLGAAVGFPRIALHAVSSDTALFPRACIYMQLDAAAADGDANEEDEDAAPEVRLAPADAGSRAPLPLRLFFLIEPTRAAPLERRARRAVDEMFKKLCECATLNPDPGLEGGRRGRCCRAPGRPCPVPGRGATRAPPRRQRTARTASSSTTRRRSRRAPAATSARRA